MTAVTQVRYLHSPGRACYDKKIAEGKTAKEALRALKRQVSDAFCRNLKADAARAATSGKSPGGEVGNDSVASAAGSHPGCHLFGQSTPGPQPLTWSAAAGRPSAALARSPSGRYATNGSCRSACATASLSSDSTPTSTSPWPPPRERPTIDWYGRRVGSLGPGLTSALNALFRLRRLSINNLVGMTAADCPRPSLLKHLDALYLHSVRPWESSPAARPKDAKTSESWNTEFRLMPSAVTVKIWSVCSSYPPPTRR